MNAASPRAPRALLLRTLGTLLALALLVYLLSQQGWDEILDSVRRVSISRFLMVVGLVFLSRMAVAARWSALLLLADIRIPILEILRITFAGLFASNFLPTSVGGDVVRLAWMAQLQSDRAKYASSIAVDRLVGLAGMAMLLPLGIIQVISDAGGRSLDWNLGPVLLPVFAIATSWPQALKARATHVLKRTRELIAIWWSNPKALLASLGFTWIHMFFWFTSMRILFDAQAENLIFWQIAGLWSFVYFISLFPVSINSLGLREVSTGLVYSTIGGTSLGSALTVALLIRTAAWIGSLPGVLSLPGILALRQSRTTSRPNEDSG